MWFRGLKNHNYALLPHIRRGYTRQKERYLTNLFYTRARTRYNNCPKDSDYGAWLALMQHYGLPTRLLDWTHSPLVAAYFATRFSFDLGGIKDPPDTDAAIWALEPHRLNKSQNYEPVFPPLNALSVKPLVIPAFKKRSESCRIQVLAVSPLETDLRMLAQQGMFTVHVIDTPLNEMPDCDKWLKKIIIPKTSIFTIARELDLLGIRLADMFPDLHHLAVELMNMHKPS